MSFLSLRREQGGGSTGEDSGVTISSLKETGLFRKFPSIHRALAVFAFADLFFAFLFSVCGCAAAPVDACALCAGG